MTVTQIEDPLNWRLAAGASGLLRTFNEAGVIEAADVHVAQRLTTLAEEADETVALAVALVVRALRGGSVCVDLRTVAAQSGLQDLPWPQPAEWLEAVRASPLIGSPPVLRLYNNLLYLDRYWLEEQQVCEDLLAMLAPKPPEQLPDINRLFPDGYEEQRAAARDDRADRWAGHG
jgi:exodeoxyribonuclease V alpha subunit